MFYSVKNVVIALTLFTCNVMTNVEFYLKILHTLVRKKADKIHREANYTD